MCTFRMYAHMTHGCVYMNVCVCVHVHACTHACEYAWMCVFYVYAYACMHTYYYLRTHINAQVYTNVEITGHLRRASAHTTGARAAPLRRLHAEPGTRASPRCEIKPAGLFINTDGAKRGVVAGQGRKGGGHCNFFCAARWGNGRRAESDAGACGACTGCLHA